MPAMKLDPPEVTLVLTANAPSMDVLSCWSISKTCPGDFLWVGLYRQHVHIFQIARLRTSEDAEEAKSKGSDAAEHREDGEDAHFAVLQVQLSATKYTDVGVVELCMGKRLISRFRELCVYELLKQTHNMRLLKPLYKFTPAVIYLSTPSLLP